MGWQLATFFEQHSMMVHQFRNLKVLATRISPTSITIRGNSLGRSDRMAAPGVRRGNTS